MKKFLFIVTIAAFTCFGAAAQTSPGKSAYGHSHKKVKKAKKHRKVYNPVAAQRKALNTQHKTTIRTIKQNDALTNQQEKTMVKQANVAHKQDMKTVSVNKKPGKNK